jgi:hypothetical protein
MHNKIELTLFRSRHNISTIHEQHKCNCKRTKQRQDAGKLRVLFAVAHIYRNKQNRLNSVD